MPTVPQILKRLMSYAKQSATTQTLADRFKCGWRELEPILTEMREAGLIATVKRGDEVYWYVRPKAGGTAEPVRTRAVKPKVTKEDVRQIRLFGYE